MRANLLLGPTIILAGAAAMWSCGSSGSSSTPAAPTAPSASVYQAGVSLSAGSFRKSDDEPSPDPAPGPTPDPTALTISIVGSFGSNAFTPNPIQASIGDLIVWKNNDSTTHNIVLDDGFIVGDVAPGASSVPMSLKSAVAAYHCTIHPTMVGSINGALAPEPLPPTMDPYPGNDYYGYGRVKVSASR